MSRPNISRPRVMPEAPAAFLDAGLVLTLVLIGRGVLSSIPNLSGQRDALVLGLFVHMVTSLYAGRFGGWRRLTWAGFIGGWFAAVAAGFLGYVLPLGQMSFWAMSMLSRQSLIDPRILWGEPSLFVSLKRLAPLLSILLDAIVVLDIALLHAERVRRWRPTRRLAFVGVVVAVVALDLVAGRLFGHPAPMPPPLRIVPELPSLPAYAILRAVSDRLSGLLLLVIFLLLPLSAPWMRAWRFHAAPVRTAWTLLWLGLVFGWVGLAMLGAMPPTGDLTLWTGSLLAYQFAFYLVVPAVLGAFVRTPSPAPEVFD